MIETCRRVLNVLMYILDFLSNIYIYIYVCVCVCVCVCACDVGLKTMKNWTN